MRDLAADTDLRFLSLNTGTVRAQDDLLSILEAALRHGISWSRRGGTRSRRSASTASSARCATAASASRAIAGAGLFPSDAARRADVRDDNRRAVDEAAALGAPCLVMVVGGLPHFSRPGSAPSHDIAVSRDQVADGIAEMLDYAEACGMPLALEPIHPMMAAERSCLCTLRQALDLCDLIDPARSRGLGIALDVYHVWWDFEIMPQIARMGGDRMLAFHVCDWLVPTTSILSGRGMMGDGVDRDPEAAGSGGGAGFRRGLRGRGAVRRVVGAAGRRGSLGDRRTLPDRLLKRGGPRAVRRTTLATRAAGPPNRVKQRGPPRR